MITRQPVALGDRAYDVVLAEGFGGLSEALAALGLGRLVVVTNPVVARLWLAPLLAELRAVDPAVSVLLVPDGERHKTQATWQRLLDGLLSVGVDRHTTIVALGGGVTGDLAGFAAATCLRGLRLVQVPTSLLAMVDSSVGGKTGVNTRHGKNLVGAFHQPALVWAALDTLATLPEPELRAGLAEGVKHGFIADHAAWTEAEEMRDELHRGAADALRALVASSVRVKAAVVAEDEREAGRRGLLNFGHTVGHALEAALGPGSLRHGQCVALGMVAEARAAASRGILDSSAVDRLAGLLLDLGLPAVAPAVPHAILVDRSRMDKKRARGIVRAPIPLRVGHAEMRDLDDAALGALFHHLPRAAAVLEDPCAP